MNQFSPLRISTRDVPIASRAPLLWVATSDFPEVKVTKAGAELKTFNQSECRKVGAKLKMGPIRRLEAKSRDLACESVVSQPYYLSFLQH